MRAICFDMDGTLYDREAMFVETFREFFPDAPRTLIHRASVCCDRRSDYALEAAAQGRMTVEEMHIHRFGKGMVDAGVTITDDMALEFQRRYAARQKALRIPERMAALVTFCRARCDAVGVITNGMEAHQRRKIEKMGLDGLVDPQHILISGACGVAKPDPEIFRIAEKRMDRQSEEMLMVGDSYATDIEGALNAGWQAVWLNREHEAVPEGRPAPQYIVHTEEEMDELIRSIIL